jgi:DNA repair exonuclease SbcCD ATPase subunit
MGFYPELSDAEEIKQLKAELRAAYKQIEELKKQLDWFKEHADYSPDWTR